MSATDKLSAAQALVAQAVRLLSDGRGMPEDPYLRDAYFALGRCFGQVLLAREAAKRSTEKVA